MSNNNTNSKSKQSRPTNRNAKRIDKNEGNQNSRDKARVTGKPSSQWSESQAVTDAINDPEWYASIPELAVSAASINYFNPLGGPTHFGEGDFDTEYLKSVPGICVLKYLPVLGVSEDNFSPINLASRNDYTFVHAVMAVGSSSYEPADLMLYAMAMGSAYSFLAWMRRLYGVMNLYSQLNKYLPDALLQAMGIPYPNRFRGKMLELYNYITTFQYKLGSFAIPTSLPYFIRQMWMCSGLYLDAPTNKAQIYMFQPHSFWIYNEYEGAGKLQRVEMPGFQDIDALKEFGNRMLSRLVASQDIYTMSGDVLHAYTDGGIFKMDALDLNYMVTPFYVPEVLTQIHNATVLGSPTPAFTEITQNPSTGLDGGSIICKPYLQGPAVPAVDAAVRNHRLLSMPMDMPNPADNLVATRLTATAEYDAEKFAFRITSCGTELITSMEVFFFHDNENGAWTLDSEVIGGYAGLCGSDLSFLLPTYVRYLGRISCFAQHPFIGLWEDSGDGLNLVAYDFDVDNYTVVDRTVLDRMHECALMSMFKVPVMGIFDRKFSK